MCVYPLPISLDTRADDMLCARVRIDRFDDPASEPAAVPVSVLKQEEEDIQRAIAESEALARNQQSKSSYPSTSYGQTSTSTYAGYQQPQAGTSGTNFFTQADGKALPEIHADPHQATASAPPAPSASPAQGPSRVKALYDFEPQEEGELAFRKGDVIRVINSAYEGWWKGELDGRVGIFPLTYIVSLLLRNLMHVHAAELVSFDPGNHSRPNARKHS